MNESPDVMILVVTFVLAQLGLFMEQRRRANKTDKLVEGVGADATTAATEATSAATRAEPVSNGFAGKVLAGLSDLSTDVREIRTRMDRFERHIDDHASADVRRNGA